MEPLVEIKDEHEEPRAKWKEWVPAPVKRYGRGVVDITLGVISFVVIMTLVSPVMFAVVLIDKVRDWSAKTRTAPTQSLRCGTDQRSNKLDWPVLLLGIILGLVLVTVIAAAFTMFESE